jgi:hypothetical protein
MEKLHDERMARITEKLPLQLCGFSRQHGSFSQQFCRLSQPCDIFRTLRSFRTALFLRNLLPNESQSPRLPDIGQLSAGRRHQDQD